MSQYDPNDTLARSKRNQFGAGSQSLTASASRPFLAILNPMSRPYNRLPNDVPLEEQDEDAYLSQSPGAGGSRGWEAHELSPRRRPQDTHEGDTEPEDDPDEPHASLMIEQARPPPKPKTSSSKRSQRGSSFRSSRRAYASDKLSRPPRPSELDDVEVLSASGGRGTATAYATTRSKTQLDAHERALWNWVNVYNLDAYLQEVYAYYTGKGIYCIALSRGLNLLTVGFVIAFSTFLLGCVDYSRVHQDGTGRLSDLVIDHCVSRFSGFSLLLFICFGLFFCVQIFEFARGIIRLMDMYRFYTHLLNVPDVDLQTISWPEVVRRIGQIRDQNPRTAAISSQHPTLLDQGPDDLHHSNSPPTATLDAHDIANRIMRQENYLIALFNKDLLDLRVPLPPLLDSWVGNYVNRGGNSTLTRALEWNLRYCILGHLFDRSGRVRRSFMDAKDKRKEVELLRKRFIFMGILNAIFAPFIVLYLLMYSFFRYFEEYHKNPSSIGGRQYTPYAEWKFREFNELPHLFRRRLNESYPVAGEYVDQFPKEKVALVMRFVAFVAGSFAAVLALATVLDPDIFLHFEITPHRTVLFYLGLFGSVLAVARGMVPDSHRVFDPEMLMREVISHTHYMPTEWKGQLHSQMVQAEFGHLFEMRIVIFYQELLSVVLTPFVLWYSLPHNADAIVDFFRQFTVHVDGLGYVCSFAKFDFKRHGNVNFGAPSEAHDEKLMSKEGKMEKSFLNFTAANPEWRPDATGSMFLSKMAEYNQRLRRHRSRTGATVLLGPQYSSGPTFIHPNDTQFLNQNQNPNPGREAKLAENAARYQQAMDRSTRQAMDRSRKGKDKGEEVPSILEEVEESELGDSYVHGVRTRGPRPEDYLEEQGEEEWDGGLMGMLAGFKQPRTIG